MMGDAKGKSRLHKRFLLDINAKQESVELNWQSATMALPLGLIE
jgi:hypothetical protein